MSKRKWEIEYEKYMNGEKEKEIKELESKDFSIKEGMTNEEKTNATKEAKSKFKEIEKYNKVKGNISKVTNIMKLKDKLQLDKKNNDELLDKVEGASKRIIKAKENMEMLDKKLEKNNKIKEEIIKRLADDKLADDKKDDLKEKLEKVNKEIDSNNTDYSKNLKELNDNQAISDKQMSIKQLKLKSKELGSKIARCNFACNCLMQGKDWNEIELKLTNWDNVKYTSNNEKLSRKEAEPKVVKTADSKVKTEDETKEVKDTKSTKMEKEDTALEEVSEFAKKHPRLAKIGNFFKNIKNKIIGKKSKEVEEVTPKVEDTVKEVKPANDRDAFVTYLKEVAEKGMEQSNKDKLAKMKEEAIKRQNEKFGEKYSSKSGDER